MSAKKSQKCNIKHSNPPKKHKKLQKSSNFSKRSFSKTPCYMLACLPMEKYGSPPEQSHFFLIWQPSSRSSRCELRKPSAIHGLILEIDVDGIRGTMALTMCSLKNNMDTQEIFQNGWFLGNSNLDMVLVSMSNFWSIFILQQDSLRFL